MTSWFFCSISINAVSCSPTFLLFSLFLNFFNTIQFLKFIMQFLIFYEKQDNDLFLFCMLNSVYKCTHENKTFEKETGSHSHLIAIHCDAVA